MDALDRWEIHEACAALVTDYCYFVDHNAASSAPDLFCQDGVLVVQGVAMEGRDALIEGFATRQNFTRRMSRHVCNNFQLKIESDVKATGKVYLTLYRHDGDPARETSPLEGPSMVGEYHDTFVKTENGWRIARRELFMFFNRDD